MPLRIALTGNIGAGKSVVAAVFERRGATIFRADEIAKELLASDPALGSAVRARFGDDTYGADGALDTRRLAERAFADAASWSDLNSLAHPYVRTALLDAIGRCQTPILVMEAALVYEAAIEELFDYVVVVGAADEDRLRRAAARGHASLDDVRRRDGFQIPQQEKLDAADFVLQNVGSVADLEAAANDLFGILLLLPPNSPPSESSHDPS